ncbi:MAG: hypothetical protein ACLGHN_09625 [Bacteriovoracia bacterium]
MKKVVALFTLVLSLGAFAQESEREPIVLNSEKIEVNASSATVVRTNQSPDVVELTFLVPMENSVCERYETRHVLRTSGAHCGYDVHTRRIRTGRVCVRTNPHNGECLRWGDTFRTETVRRPRSCMVPETYCAQYGTATSFERENMKIKFKNLPALGDSESETFSIEATQKRYDSGSVVFDVKPLETLRVYEVKREKFLFWKKDVYVVQEK